MFAYQENDTIGVVRSDENKRTIRFYCTSYRKALAIGTLFGSIQATYAQDNYTLTVLPKHNFQDVRHIIGILDGSSRVPEVPHDRSRS